MQGTSAVAQIITSTVRLSVVLAVGVVISACGGMTGKSTGSGVVSIVIPKSTSKSAAAPSRGLSTASTDSMAVSTSSYNWSNACFALNVTAPDMPVQVGTKTGACAVPIGIFSGFVAPGGTLSLAVPYGTGRTLQIFSYLRENANLPCPSQVNLGSISKSKLVLVGTVPSFDITSGSVNLDITLTSPTVNQSLVTQLSLPASCAVGAPPAQASANITAGHAVLKGTSTKGTTYQIRGSISGLSNEKFLTGGKYTMHLSRQIN